MKEFFSRPDSPFFLLVLWNCGQRRGVLLNQLPFEGLVEAVSEKLMDLPHRGGGTEFFFGLAGHCIRHCLGFQELLIILLQHPWRDILQLHVSDHRPDIVVDGGYVAAVCG